MTNKSNQIVYFGSGPVAEASLKELVKVFDVEAVITKKSTAREMSEAAPESKLLVANTRAELDSLFEQKKFESRVGVLVDYGVIVSSKVIDSFPMGIVNSHFSLLPKWRGADPISFFILSGEKTTGVSLMLLVEGMDEGPILSQASYTPPKDVTGPQLTNRLIELSNQSLKELLPKYLKGQIKPEGQNHSKATYTRKLTKEDGRLDWNKTAEQLEREIRAFIEWPRSYTKLGSVNLIVREAAVVKKEGTPGEVEVTNKELCVYCSEDALQLLKVQPAGKKEITSAEFLAGYKNRLNSE